MPGDEQPFRSEGLMLALPGTAAPSRLRTWVARLGEDGRVWTTCRGGRGAHPTSRSLTATVSTGSSGSKAGRSAERLVGAPASLAASGTAVSVTRVQHPVVPMRVSELRILLLSGSSQSSLLGLLGAAGACAAPSA